MVDVPNILHDEGAFGDGPAYHSSGEISQSYNLELED